MDNRPEKKLYLICNAHLDPAWLWNWEEGQAEALSTFRIAARFCAEFDGFVFCHNEALLYQWVEEHEPALFEQIKNLVAHGKWHIMGGWYLQPDCNLPSGESLVRQILAGKRYFLEKFQTESAIAVNLDPFGHSRGLVQILKKSGYRGYLFCRPDQSSFPLKSPDFIWEGYAGTEILCHRPPDHYNSQAGKAAGRIRRWLDANSDRQVGLLLWGIGNHGGGPSREDLLQLADLITEVTDRSIEHATPEHYFDWLQTSSALLDRLAIGLNPWGVGCYTSMARVKRKHRQLENLLFMTERMAVGAYLQVSQPYPAGQIREALADLLFCEFHDALPGTSVAEVEESILQKLDHGLEVLARARSGIFLKLLAGQPEAAPGEFPIFVYNSHPYDSDEIIVCEFQPQEPNFDKSLFWLPELTDAQGGIVPVQLEKESCNIATDQRKRIVFRSRLQASAMHRFSCRLRNIPVSVRDFTRLDDAQNFSCHSDACCVEINLKAGLLDRYAVHGEEVLRPGSFRPVVMKDCADPWGMKVDSFRNLEGEFRLLTGEESAAFAGVAAATLPPVRIIESGPVRTVVEALLGYGHSRLVMRYHVPVAGTEIEIEARVFWQEKDRMLKLVVPTMFSQACCFGQVAYGVEEFAPDSRERVAQKWLAVRSADRGRALTLINDRTYGFDFKDDELRLSLLRSPAYAGHPVDDVTSIVRQDRFETRIDQGEHKFTFWLNYGPAEDRLRLISTEAQFRNEPYVVLCVSPSGAGNMPMRGIRLSNPAIQLGACKQSEDGMHIILRLFETTGRRQTTCVIIPAIDLNLPVVLGANELKSFAIDPSTKAVREIDLLERPLSTA